MDQRLSDSEPKPKELALAVNALWASLAVGLVKLLIDHARLGSMAPPLLTNFTLVFTFVLMALLIFKISHGRNWARITSLVLFLFGLLPAVPIMLREFVNSPVTGALSLAQAAIQAFAFYLLFFSAAAEYFKKKAAA